MALHKEPPTEELPPRGLARDRILLFVSGILFTIALLLITRLLGRMSLWLAIPGSICGLVLAVSVGVWLLKRTNGVYCPRCNSPRAKLIYLEENGVRVEYVQCPVCNDRRRTGRSLPTF